MTIVLLQEYPELPAVATRWEKPAPSVINWPALLSEVLSRGAAVPEVTWCQPGKAPGTSYCAGAIFRMLAVLAAAASHAMLVAACRSTQPPIQAQLTLPPIQARM